jgi:LPS export ABC transporter protein LptC
MRRLVALVGTLGVVSVGTVACGRMEQPPTARTDADSADQVGYGVTHILTSDGVRRMRLEAESVYAYAGPQRHELFGIKVTFFDPNGVETSTLTAREGTYEWRSGNMEARGDVVTISPDGRRLETSILQYDRATDRIVGPADFRWRTPEQDVEGEGFTTDPELRNVETTRLRGTLGRVRVDQ